jgi:putative iron-dependent peroxidase
MATPQHGIFALGTRSHHHLELDLTAGADPATVLDVLCGIRSRTTTVANVNLVVGLGPDLCRQAAPPALPADMAPFEPIVGPDGFTMPATQHDLWLWFHGSAPDAIFGAARAAAAGLDGLARVTCEQAGFGYLSGQDLTGFEDGTENPPIDEAPAAAVVPRGRPGAGSSVVLVQRWVHDLDGFDRLPPDDRDQVIGRTLTGSEELPDDVRSEHAHISRVVVEDDDGEELEIFRRSSAFGGVLEHGLQFVAFSADLARLRRMLRNMAGLGDGVRDRLTELSTPTTGAWYVAPPTEVFSDKSR